MEASVEIAVCLKRVPDTAEADVKVDPTGKDIVRDKLAFTINEADNYALEEALLAKEKHNANVTLVSAGSQQAEEVLRMGMAKGATAAARIDGAGLGECDGVGLARVLAAFEPSAPPGVRGLSMGLLPTALLSDSVGRSCGAILGAGNRTLAETFRMWRAS